MRIPLAAISLVLVACAPATSSPASTTVTTTAVTTASVTTASVGSSTTTTTPTTTTPGTTTTVDPFAPPPWLGTRELELRADGFGVPQPTPDVLFPRAIRTVDLLEPPTGSEFESTVGRVPADVVERSTWSPECPVSLDQLRYLTVTHWGFDGEPHTGELIVNAAFAEEIAGVFRRLHELRFPIEQMRVVTPEMLDAHPTGDGNLTTAFVCRQTTASSSWSMHASGLALDLNPFHNPYVKGDLVLPELSGAYVDRTIGRPGMVDEEVVRAFAAIGWSWGGDWTSLSDWMHFSSNGR